MIVRQLGELGIVVQDTRKGADFTLGAKIVATPSGTAGQTRVEIQWTVADPYGREIGHLLQLNGRAERGVEPALGRHGDGGGPGSRRRRARRDRQHHRQPHPGPASRSRTPHPRPRYSPRAC